jgi:uncharacterized OB-fold protein
VAEEIKSIRTPIRLEYDYTAGRAATRFLRGVARGKLIGQRCTECKRVYVPARGACPRCAAPVDEEVELADKGTITTFSIVRVPSENLSFDPPYVAASILLDGADIPFTHVLQECPLEEVRMGMRVQAVWVPAEELGPTMASVRYFKPIEEPDADFDSYKEHL